MTQSLLKEPIPKEETPPNLLYENMMVQKWQERLLPLMIRMIVGLTLFFFLATFAQLIYLQWTINNSPKLDINESLSLLVLDSKASPEDILAAAKLKALVSLEATSLQHNYHQANVLLMSRTWIRYLGFVTGMILALVGATYILGKLQEATSELHAKAERTELSLKSASPRLILAVLGVLLILTTIIIHHRIDVKDAAVYIRDLPTAMTVKASPPPPLERPKGDDPNRIGR